MELNRILRSFDAQAGCGTLTAGNIVRTKATGKEEPVGFFGGSCRATKSRRSISASSPSSSMRANSCFLERSEFYFCVCWRRRKVASGYETPQCSKTSRTSLCFTSSPIYQMNYKAASFRSWHPANYFSACKLFAGAGTIPCCLIRFFGKKCTQRNLVALREAKRKRVLNSLGAIPASLLVGKRWEQTLQNLKINLD